jgi:hypothetical protein
MAGTSRWPRRLIVAGLVAMVAGAVDPLEGSVVILAGSVLVALGAYLSGNPRARLTWAALALIAVGVAAMFAISAVGGFGGRTGRSTWWGLLLLPYPIGWVIGLVAAVRCLRARATVAAA